MASSLSDSVAVIIPTHNRAHTLGRALESVYGQSRPADEVCVIDDGSEDTTRQLVLEQFPQSRYIYQPNAGVSSARNAGVAATESAWLAFLDSDDEWLPTKLERQLAEISHDPACRLLHCDEIWIRNGVRVNPRDKHRKKGGDVFEHCLRECVIAPSAVIWQRSLLEEMHGFDEELPVCEDYDLWLKIGSRYPVAYVDEALLNKFGGHEDQLSSRHWGMDRFRVRALANLLDSATLTSQQYSAARRTLLAKSEILVQGALKRGNEATATAFQAVIDKYSNTEKKSASAEILLQ